MSQCRECFKRIPRDEATCFDCCSVLLDAGKADLYSRLAAAEERIKELEADLRRADKAVEHEMKRGGLLEEDLIVARKREGT